MSKELEGGALYPDVKPKKSRHTLAYSTDTHDVYMEPQTPMRTIYTQIAENWTPMMRHHEPPDFAMMRRALEFDDTSYDDEVLYAPRPDNPPTGHGMLRDDRETSHYVGTVLDSINPHLATAYRGGAINSHLERAYLNRDVQYSRGR